MSRVPYSPQSKFHFQKLEILAARPSVWTYDRATLTRSRKRFRRWPCSAAFPPSVAEICIGKRLSSSPSSTKIRFASVYGAESILARISSLLKQMELDTGVSVDAVWVWVYCSFGLFICFFSFGLKLRVEGFCYTILMSWFECTGSCIDSCAASDY